MYAVEFQVLAPQEVSYDDLEVNQFLQLSLTCFFHDHPNPQTAQQDVLGALSYTLGVTPQGVLDDAWNALPELREMFGYDGGWNSVLKQTWDLLFASVLGPCILPCFSYLINSVFSESDVLRFPVWLLTAAALAESIISTLVSRYEYLVPWNAHPCHARRTGKEMNKHFAMTGTEDRQKLVKKAERETEGVLLDLMAAMGIREVRRIVTREGADEPSLCRHCLTCAVNG